MCLGTYLVKGCQIVCGKTGKQVKCQHNRTLQSGDVFLGRKMTSDLDLSCVLGVEFQGLVPLPVRPPRLQHGLQFLVVTC